MIRKVLVTTTAILSFAAASGTAQATLLTNGDFDEDVGLKGTSWAVYKAIPGWTTGSGAGIEVQRGTVVAADSLSQYVELDSHGRNSNSAMFQSVLLDTGLYELAWKYHARTNNGDDDNGIKAYLTDASDTFLYDIGSISGKDNQQQSTWEDVAWSFSIASNDTYRLWFAAYGKQNTLGGFIDSVSLTSSPVPEPATMLLFGAGLSGLAAICRRRKP